MENEFELEERTNIKTKCRIEVEKREPLWTKYFILMMLYSLASSIAVYIVATSIPLYAVYIGGDKSMAGLLMGVFMLAAVVCRPIFGRILDTRSRRSILMAGAIICTGVYISYSLTYSISALLIMRMINGIGFSANTNASGTVVSDIIPKSRLAEGVGYYGIANTLATTVGPGLTLFIIKNYSYNTLFIITIIIGLISVIISYFIDYETKSTEYTKVISKKREINKEESIHNKKGILDSVFEKSAIPIAIVTIFLAITIGSIMTFIPLYATARGIEDISMFFIVYAFALMLTRLFVGRIADRFGASVAIIPGMSIVIIAFIILASAKNLPLFLVGAFVYGIGYGSSLPTLNAVMIKLCPPDRRGVGNATFYCNRFRFRCRSCPLGNNISKLWFPMSIFDLFSKCCGFIVSVLNSVKEKSLNKQFNLDLHKKHSYKYPM